MARNGKILVVGGLKKNWKDFLSEPKITLWVDDEADEHYVIPKGVIQVVASHFVSHSTWARVVEMARRQGVTYSVGLKSPGEIKSLLQDFKTAVNKKPTTFITPMELLARRAEEAKIFPKEEHMVPTEKKMFTSLAEFVRTEANFDAENRTAEIARLANIGQSLGLNTKALPRTFYTVRAKQHGNLRTSSKKMARADKHESHKTPQKCSGAECITFLKNNADMFGVAILEVIQHVDALELENRRLKAELAPVAGELKRLRRMEALIKKVAR